jgi:CubicO group peptidase (beta-lactamase class C family)
MASLTKAFSGSVMMMLVDQGLVSLDDPVSKFFPSFRNATVPVPLTVRNLYTHTGGLDGHWGDRLNDLDDLLAGEYPYLKVGKELRYDEVGPALGSKIVESVTGEALPQFYRHHLFDPLGCTHTTATDSGGNGNSNSAPMDMAKFGQMLLNRGSYGNKQFMRPETFAQMLPEKLTKELGPDTTVQWGIGLIWGSEGLGKGTFGHGAASGALFRVDPEHDMVVVITRNAWGANLDKYQNKFLTTLVDNLEPNNP